MDFTLNTYRNLLLALLENDFRFQTFSEYLTLPQNKSIILRHDIDLLPENALKIAEIESKLNIKSSFYFQVSAKIFKRDVIKQIVSLGHEIGYHYKDVESVVRKFWFDPNNKQDLEKIIDYSFDSFKNNLTIMRTDTDVKTICMHGSPRFRLDNRIIWSKYNYKTLGLLGDPYFDIDWSKCAYLTDSARRWNGNKYIIRDKVESKFNFNFHSTSDIINGINDLPSNVMITTHPQRWSNNPVLWLKEYLFQNTKNIIKQIMIRKTSIKKMCI